MEANSNGPTTFMDLPTDNLLEHFPHEISITSKPVLDLLKPIRSEVHSPSTETQDKDNPSSDLQERHLCKECKYIANNADRLTRHIRKVHRGENPYQCFMCDYSTYNKTLFDEHVRIHKGIKPFKCSYCPHRNVSKKNLKRHERIHRPDNPLKCPNCEFIARNKRAYNCHMKKHHLKLDPNLNCNWCHKVFANENSLVLHTTQIQTCDVFTDDINKDSKKCNYTACSAYKMKVHKERVHGQVKTIKELWECGLCEWNSQSKTKILLHLIHHPNQKVDEDVIDVSILRKHGIM